MAAASGEDEGEGIVKIMKVDDFEDADKWTDISEDDERGFDPRVGPRNDKGKNLWCAPERRTGTPQPHMHLSYPTGQCCEKKSWTQPQFAPS